MRCGTHQWHEGVGHILDDHDDEQNRHAISGHGWGLSELEIGFRVGVRVQGGVGAWVRGVTPPHMTRLLSSVSMKNAKWTRKVRNPSGSNNICIR